jgi:hypothetical protein
MRCPVCDADHFGYEDEFWRHIFNHLPEDEYVTYLHICWCGYDNITTGADVRFHMHDPEYAFTHYHQHHLGVTPCREP